MSHDGPLLPPGEGRKPKAKRKTVSAAESRGAPAARSRRADTVVQASPATPEIERLTRIETDLRNQLAAASERAKTIERDRDRLNVELVRLLDNEQQMAARLSKSQNDDTLVWRDWASETRVASLTANLEAVRKTMTHELAEAARRSVEGAAEAETHRARYEVAMQRLREEIVQRQRVAAERDRLSEALGQAGRHADSLVVERDRFQKLYDDAREAHDRLVHHAESLGQQLAEQSACSVGEFDALKQALEMETARADRSELELSAARESLAAPKVNAAGELETAHAEIQRLNQDVLNAGAVLEAVRDEAQHRLEQADRDLTVAREALAETRAASAVLQQSFGTAQAERDRAVRDRDQIESEREQIAASAFELTASNAALTAALSELAAENARLVESKEAVTALHNRAAAHAIQLGERADDLQKRVDELEIKRSEGGQHIAGLGAETQRLSGELEQAQSQIVYLERKRAEGGMHLQGLERTVQILTEEMQRRQATIDEIRGSTTWMLSRAFVKLGRITPRPIRRMMRGVLSSMVRVSQAGRRKKARPADGDSSGKDGGRPAPPPTAAAALATGREPLFSTIDGAPHSSERGHNEVTVIVAVRDMPEAMLASLSEIAATDTEVIFCFSPPRKIAGAVVMQGGGNLVEHVDRVIRSCGTPVVAVIATPLNLPLASLRRMPQSFEDNPRVVAFSGMMRDPSDAAPHDFREKTVRRASGLSPGLVVFDTDAYSLLEGLDSKAATLADALRRFCTSAEKSGFDIAQDPFIRADVDWTTAAANQTAVTSTASGALLHGKRPRALFCDLVTPTPDRDCGSLNLFWCIRILQSLGYDCTFMASHERGHAGRYTDELRQIGVDVVLAENYEEPWKFLQEYGPSFDLVMLFRVGSACNLIDPVRQFAPQAKVIFNTVDLHFLREERAARLANSAAALEAAAATRREELRVIGLSDMTTIVSSFEMDLLDEIQPGLRKAWIPIVNPVAGLQAPAAGRKGVMFVGGFGHHPNKDAVFNFCAEIWPRVRRLAPDAEFHIIGSSPPPEIRALELPGNGVHVVGFVESLADWYRTMRVNVAPLRYGGGVKGKVISSLSVGLPTVATSMAVEGMGLTHGFDAMVADDPETFALHIAELCSSDTVWENMARASVATARRIYSVEAIREKFIAVLADLSLPH